MPPKQKLKTPEFLNRISSPESYPFIQNDDGSVSTHRMAAETDEDGNWFVFPTIVQFEDGNLHQFSDNRTAMDYNMRTGNYIKMKSKEEALNYAEGGYKKGTPLETFNSRGRN